MAADALVDHYPGAARALFDSGDVAKAISTQQTAVELSGNNPEFQQVLDRYQQIMTNMNANAAGRVGSGDWYLSIVGVLPAVLFTLPMAAWGLAATGGLRLNRGNGAASVLAFGLLAAVGAVAEAKVFHSQKEALALAFPDADRIEQNTHILTSGEVDRIQSMAQAMRMKARKWLGRLS